MLENSYYLISHYWSKVMNSIVIKAQTTTRKW